MLPIKQMILTNKNRPGYKLKKLKGIAIHWTGNEGPGANAVANRNYFNTTDRACSAHYIVDDHQIVQCVPDNEVAWHVGAQMYKPKGEMLRERPYSPNYFLIGIEMCVNADGNWSKTYQNSVELVAYLLRKYNLSIQDMYRHYDITGKDCPKMMLDDAAWNAFKAAVDRELKQSSTIYYETSKKGMLLADTLACKETPSNSARSNGVLRKGQHDPLTIYAEAQAEGIKWYLINKATAQWVAAHYVKIG